MSLFGRSVRSFSVSLMFAGSLALTGCGGSSATPADALKATDALKLVLDGWKSGASTESLAGQSPSIHVSDLDWKQGYKLVGYQTVDEGHLVGFDMNYKVQLDLKSPKGKAIKRSAVYTISTTPDLLVLRQEG